MDYKREYDEYWSRPDRWGSHSFDKPELLADEILSICPGEKMLDVGFGMGLLVRTLVKKGVDAAGIDIAQRPVDEANKTLPGRFRVGSILNIPFPDHSFDTVISTDCLEHIAEEDVPRALAELRRVTRRFVYVRLATTQDRDKRWHLTVRDRAWWENQCFQAGLRKNPLTQDILPYETLEHEPWQITLLLEKIPDAALEKYPPATLKAERDLHMDMLRETGRRSDAHIVRYALAKASLPKNGLVVDVACGLGYGSALLAQSNSTNRVVGIDFSEFAVDYARHNFSVYTPNAEFSQGDACDLSRFADASVDLVVSFETVEHLKHPEIFLKEVRRVLKPGGRFIGSVPDKWVDESGKDPNPWHFHVFDCRKFAALCEKFFQVERIYGQLAGGGMKLTTAPRSICEFQQPLQGNEDTEWCLIVGVATDAPEHVVILSHENEKANPLYTSWIHKMKRPVRWITNCGPDWEPPTGTGLIITHDHYNEPWVSIIRRAVEKNIPTLVLADGILEYRNTFEHPGLVEGSIYQPVLGHKLACIGPSQARVVESWGNPGVCEVVGMPKLDEVKRPESRQRQLGEPLRLLVMTAKTPAFTPAQREKVLRSLADLKQHLAERISKGEQIQVTWRLSGELATELGVPNTLGSFHGELTRILKNMDAVITTPSTALLEAAFFRLPAALLDYTNSPQFVPAAWTISSPEHIGPVLDALANPPQARMQFQETALRDALEFHAPAAPRLMELIEGMIETGREAREKNKPLVFGASLLPAATARPFTGFLDLHRIYPDQPAFAERDLAALQVELVHLRNALAQFSVAKSGRPVRLLFVSTNEGAFGGSEELWSQAALVSRKWNRAVAVSVRRWQPGEGRLNVLREAGCEMFPHDVPVTRDHIAKALEFSPDLVVLSQGYNLEGLDWMEQLSEKSIPFVNIIQCVHETGWAMAQDSLIQRLVTAFRKSKRLCFVSENNRQLHEKMLGMRFPASVVIRNPYKVSRTADIPWPDSETFHVGLVGRIETLHKGQDLLLEVLRQDVWKRRNVHFHLYGSGPHEELLRRLIAEWSIPNCTLEGHVSDVESIWRKCHACLQPSRFEGLPLTVVEAMMCGRMVVATDVGGHSELVVDGETGFLARSASARDLAAAMEQAWEARGRWQDLGRAARKQILTLVSEDPTVEFLNGIEPFIPKFFKVPSAEGGVRNKSATARSGTDHIVQLFYSERGHFNEAESHSLPCPSNKWVKLTFNACFAQFRLDPSQRACVAEIAALQVRSCKDGRIAWESHPGSSRWNEIELGGDATRASHTQWLKLFCDGNDPRLKLPKLKGLKAGESLEITVVLRISDSLLVQEGSPDDLLGTLQS